MPFSRASSWPQGSNLGFLHFRQILYYLSHQRSPFRSLHIHKSGDNINLEVLLFFPTFKFVETILLKLFRCIFDLSVFGIVPSFPTLIPSDDSHCSKENLAVGPEIFHSQPYNTKLCTIPLSPISEMLVLESINSLFQDSFWWFRKHCY